MLFSREKKQSADKAASSADLENKMTAIQRSQAVIEFNLDGTIITANPNFTSTMGYSLPEIVGAHHRMFVDPDEVRSQAYLDFWRELNDGKFVARKFRRIAKGGRDVWLQASYNPVLDASGRAYKVIKIAVDITAAEHLAQQNEADRAVSEKVQAEVVATLADSLRRVSEGDLTAQIDKPFQGSYEKIREDFNIAVASMREAMEAISSSTEGIRGGSEEIAKASNDLSRRTEQQAASLEETAAALDEITATVKRGADGAKLAATAASGAKTDAEKSGEVVREAVSAMGEIEQSSKKITQIISVIDEIAFQTNLLALNAGVEAARAGDAGRGFAVVAQEVRALAQRSADAAKEIKALISSSTDQVAKGAKLVSETGEALSGIVTKVAEIDLLVADIAVSSQEQATGLNEVNTAVNQMDQVTQQNAAMVEEATAAAASLLTEAQTLAQHVGRFSVGGGSRTGSRPEPARAGQHAPVSSPANAARARVKSAFAGGAAKADPSWTEF
jgi:methyl-accepting chemotaxis protein